MNPLNLFYRMKISRLILIGFGFVIGTVIAISLSAVLGTLNSASGFKEYRTQARTSNFAASIDSSMLSVRLAVMKFLMSNAESDVQVFNQNMDTLTKTAENAKSILTDKDTLEKLVSIQKNAEAYRNDFKELVSVIYERNKLKSAMKADGEKMTDMLNELRAISGTSQALGAAQENLIRSRFNADEFINLRDRKYYNETLSSLGTEINSSLSQYKNSSGKAGNIYNNFMETKNRFLENITKVAPLLEKRDVLVNDKLSVLGVEITKATKAMTSDAQAHQDQIGPRIQSNNKKITFFVSLFSIIGLAVALFFARVITVGVKRPLGGEPVEMSEIARKIASGDLRIQFDNSGKITGLYEAMKQMRDNLSDVVGKIRLSSESVASGSTELASASEELSTTFGDQSAQISSIAGAMEEMAATSQEVMNNLEIVMDKSNHTKKQTDKGKSTLAHTNKSIENISRSAADLSGTITNLTESSTQISNILNVINDIADQTNLLALNAAIEAARAGDAGRGFAVVADEVRKLAERSQNAIQEIDAIITNLQKDTKLASVNMTKAGEQVEEGVDALKSTIEVFDTIVSAIDDVINSNNAISTAVSQQNTAILSINDSVQMVSSGLEQSTAAISEITVTINDLSQQAEAMNETVQVFKI
jgi:methyl-accepting chemotaxis protein